MGFNFPNTPAEDQAFTPPGGPPYVYKNGMWRAIGGVGRNQYATRDDLKAALATGFMPVQGTIYIAGGFAYLGMPGSVAIPDMSNLIPWGDVHVEHFGAKGDMTFEFRTMTNAAGTPVTECVGMQQLTPGALWTPAPNYEAPYRTGGTNDWAAFDAADNYTTTVLGTGVFYAEAGGVSGDVYKGYFIDGQLKVRGSLISRRGFRNYLWIRNDHPHKACFWIDSVVSAIKGFNVVDQYDYTTPKASGAGMCGPGVTLARMTNEFGGPALYSPGAQPILTDIELDLRFCRAGYCSAFSPSSGPSNNAQGSLGAYHVVSASGVEYSKFKIGLFGKTNSSSNGTVLAHWGARVALAPGKTGPVSPFTNWHGLQLVEQYCTCDSEFEFVGHHDEWINPHGIPYMMWTAGTGTSVIKGISCRGVSALGLTPGDGINEWMNKRQKDKACKGMKVEYINCLEPSLFNGRRSGSSYLADEWGEAQNNAIVLAGAGTVQHVWDRYPGTPRQRGRQQEVDYQLGGANVSRVDGPPAWNGRGLFANMCLGRIITGALTTYGLGRGLEFQFCDGDQSINYVEGDSCLNYWFSRGARFHETDTDRNRPGYVDDPLDGAYRPGMAAGTKAIQLTGYEYSTVVTIPAGQVNTTTKTYITPFAGADDDVGMNTPFRIGNDTDGYEWATITDRIEGRTAYTFTGMHIENTNPARLVISVLDICRLYDTLDLTQGYIYAAGTLPRQEVLISGLSGAWAAANGTWYVKTVDNNYLVEGISRGAFYLENKTTGLLLDLSAAPSNSPENGFKVTPVIVGVNYILHTPLPRPALAGDKVYIEEAARVRTLSLSSAGGESGLRATNATIDQIDMHMLRSAGRYGLNLVNARTTLKGPMPMTVGATPMYSSTKPITQIDRTNPVVVTCPGHGLTTGTRVRIDKIGAAAGMVQMNNKIGTITVMTVDHFSMAIDARMFTTYVPGPAATAGRAEYPFVENYSVLGDSRSLFAMSDGTVKKNVNVAFHFHTNKDDTTGSKGHVDLRNCRIEDIDRLMLGGKSTLRYSLTMAGCTDYEKNQNLSHPGRQGQDEDQNIPGARGFYQYADDGMLNCWIRSITTGPADSNGLAKATWIYPAPFNAGGDTVAVTVQISTDIGSARAIDTDTGSSEHVVINIHGWTPGATATFSAHAIGRYFDE